MAPTLLELADSQNKFEDLSGVNSSAYSNPYDALIEACEDNPVKKNVCWSLWGFLLQRPSCIQMLHAVVLFCGSMLTFPDQTPSTLLNPPQLSKYSTEGQTPLPGFLGADHRPYPWKNDETFHWTRLQGLQTLSCILGSSSRPYPLSGQ